jgi:hypothetical protein
MQTRCRAFPSKGVSEGGEQWAEIQCLFRKQIGDLSVDKEKGVLGLLKQNVIIEEVFFARRIWSIIR